jgi:OOP family OmpA-OmpF porin
MKQAFLAAVLATITTAALAQSPYAKRTDSQQWLNGFGECWRTGTWTRDQSAAPCDPIAPAPRAAEPAAAPAPVQVATPPAPEPQPQPAPVVAQPAPAAPEKVTLSADVLFEFNSATLKDAGKRDLDKIADRLRNAQELRIVGHADRLGGAQYNQKLSEQRASSVKDYLATTSGAQNILTAGKGKLEPVTGGACNAKMSRRQLIGCLQPDRRVEIEFVTLRTAAK